MAFEKIKRVIEKNEYHKTALVLIVLFIMFLYFKTFFSFGVFYDDIFLKREYISGERHYIGHNEYGRIEIAVKRDKADDYTKNVIFNFPNNTARTYSIKYDDDNTVETIKNDAGEIIFKENNDTVTRVMGQGATFIIDDTEIKVKKSAVNSGYYYISLKDISSFARRSKGGIRGDASVLIIAIIIALFYFVELIYPKFFFKMQHFLSVKNPEPSNLYIKVQRISWYIYPVLIFILLFNSLRL